MPFGDGVKNLILLYDVKVAWNSLKIHVGVQVPVEQPIWSYSVTGSTACFINMAHPTDDCSIQSTPAILR